MSSTNATATASDALEAAHPSSEAGPTMAYAPPLAAAASRTSTDTENFTRINSLLLLLLLLVVNRLGSPPSRLDDEDGALVALMAVT
jgi:hypothetical protein